MLYRRLTPDDAALASTIGAFREGLIERDAVARFLSDERDLLFCAVDGDCVAGFAYGYRLPRTDGGRDMLYVHEVCVAEDSRGQGVGKAMLLALIDYARDAGMGKMFLITDRSNVAANALYRSVGGESAGDACYYFGLN